MIPGECASLEKVEISTFSPPLHFSFTSTSSSTFPTPCTPSLSLLSLQACLFLLYSIFLDTSASLSSDRATKTTPWICGNTSLGFLLILWLRTKFLKTKDAVGIQSFMNSAIMALNQRQSIEEKLGVLGHPGSLTDTSSPCLPWAKYLKLTPVFKVIVLHCGWHRVSGSLISYNSGCTWSQTHTMISHISIIALSQCQNRTFFISLLLFLSALQRRKRCIEGSVWRTHNLIQCCQESGEPKMFICHSHKLLRLFYWNTYVNVWKSVKNESEHLNSAPLNVRFKKEWHFLLRFFSHWTACSFIDHSYFSSENRKMGDTWKDFFQLKWVAEN